VYCRCTPALAGPLQVTGLINHQHRTRITQVINNVATQVIPDRRGVPAGTGHQVLHPVRGGIPGMLSNGPAVLAPQARQ